MSYNISSLQDLKDLADACRSAGILHIRLADGTQVALDPVFRPPQPTRQTPSPAPKVSPPADPNAPPVSVFDDPSLWEQAEESLVLQ